MNVLSIGNSFSQDAQRYLHQIAEADGFSLQCANLYIGGCSLKTHRDNMLTRAEAYNFETNGSFLGPLVSLENALKARSWDIVTLQQVSQESPDYATYQPYLNELAAYVRRLVPKAKLAFHQTWAYEQGSHGLNEQMGYSDHKQMLRDIMDAYRTAAEHIGADYIIPAGEVLGALQDAGVGKVHSDTKHANRGLGEYALGLVWYRFLTGNDIAQNTFCDFDEEVTPEQIAAAKSCVMEIARKYKM
jgi:hypothetical protein